MSSDAQPLCCVTVYYLLSYKRAVAFVCWTCRRGCCPASAFGPGSSRLPFLVAKMKIAFVVMCMKCYVNSSRVRWLCYVIIHYYSLLSGVLVGRCEGHNCCLPVEEITWTCGLSEKEPPSWLSLVKQHKRWSFHFLASASQHWQVPAYLYKVTPPPSPVTAWSGNSPGAERKVGRQRVVKVV